MYNEFEEIYEVGIDVNLDSFVFDLQLFAAEDEGRTEEPTEKKIREAREKGQVAKTDELPQAIVVILGFMTIFFTAKISVGRIAKIMKYYFTNFATMEITMNTVRIEGYKIAKEMAIILLPIFIICMIGGLIGNIMQVGFKFSAHPIRFDPSKIKIAPNEMLKKILLSRQVAMNLLKAIVKILIIGVSSYLIIRNDFDFIMKTPDIEISLALSRVGFSALKIILWSAILLIILSVPDYFFQRLEFVDSLKMSKQEIKEELKETMGDPHMRARLREMQREMMTRNMIKEVPNADVVVTNPTHFAVALAWNRERGDDAPAVIAKGLDSMALRIKEIAKENDVMTIENRPLAQELYKRLEIGDIIPEDLFKAVSEIYSVLYRNGRMQQAI